MKSEYTTDSTNVGEWVFKLWKNRLQRGRRHLKDPGMFFDQITMILRIQVPLEFMNLE